MNSLALTLDRLGRSDEAKKTMQRVNNLIKEVLTLNDAFDAEIDDSYKTILNKD